MPCKINTYKGLEKKNILENIRFTAFRNEVVSFIDYKNESKSALMKMLLNDEKSDSFLEDDLRGEILYSKQLKVSFCSDKNIFCGEMTAVENLELFSALKDRSLTREERNKEIGFMLDEFNIVDSERVKRASSLSGGNLKRLGLACAFIGNPEVVILNEPTLGLDLRFKRIFWDKLRTWKEGRLIIVGTSDSE